MILLDILSWSMVYLFFSILPRIKSIHKLLTGVAATQIYCYVLH